MTHLMSLREHVWTEMASGEVMALLAYMSAVSLPGIPTWLGIHSSVAIWLLLFSREI